MPYLVGRLVLAATLIIAGTAVRAQSPAETVNPAAFVKKAATMNLVELELGKIAEEKASNDEVKSFAHHLVTDHTDAQAELIKAAKLTAAALPTESDPTHSMKKEHLLEQSGVAFDRAYIEAVTLAHAEAEAFLLHAAGHQADPALRQWANSTAAIVRGHLAEARRLKELLTSPGR